MKILHVVGARPHFVKLSPVIEASRDYGGIINVIVHTGQHYDSDMSDSFFLNLNIPSPDYNLDVGSHTHGIQTGRMLERLEPILLNEKPDVVLVYGDTNTTAAGALASYKLHIPTGHVEAGMRENIWRPEEINKKIADHCSDFLFCPIKSTVGNLLKENITNERIFLVGDVTYDTFLLNKQKAIKKNIEESMIKAGKTEDYILVTMHRAEMVDYYDKVKNIIDALLEIKEKIIFPVHPRTMKKLVEFGLYDKLLSANHIKVIDPISYLEFINLLLGSKLVITDSGGVTKEAFYALKPCVSLDYSSEYNELFEMGYAILTCGDKDRIINAVDIFSKNELKYRADDLFGKGDASKKIINILINQLDGHKCFQ